MELSNLNMTMHPSPLGVPMPHIVSHLAQGRAASFLPGTGAATKNLDEQTAK